MNFKGIIEQDGRRYEDVIGQINGHRGRFVLLGGQELTFAPCVLSIDAQRYSVGIIQVIGQDPNKPRAFEFETRF